MIARHSEERQVGPANGNGRAAAQRALAEAPKPPPTRPAGALHSSGGPPAPPVASDFDGLFAGSRAMQAVKTLIHQVADTDATVLIEGESGVGKGLVAQALHAHSARRDQPLVRVNCAALPAELLESELFGYVRGAFTGAHRRKPGKFDLAHGGTILLDEVGEIPLPLQPKLLQVVQDGEFSRLGDEHAVRVNVRVLAATNRDLGKAMAAGAFREDLYYRLNVVRIEVPPLRERREEIPFLAEHFLRLHACRYNRPIRGLAAETLALFLAYDWPGNVRELENLVKRVLILEDEAGVRAELRGPGAGGGGGDAREGAGAGPSLKTVARRAMGDVERTLIRQALERTRWNRMEAARLLRISYRALRYKMEQYTIATPPSRTG